MEQLSVGAIQKLWELCSKVLPAFGRGDGAGASPAPVEEGSPPAHGGAPNRKKNKPMNAREQEERINHLTRIQEQFRASAHGGQAGSPQANESINAATTPTAGYEDSSEESDSEEE